MIQSLNIARTTVGNTYIEGQFDEVINTLGNGGTLSQALNTVEGFDMKLNSTILVGEESGRLDVILLRLDDALEQKNALRQKITTALVYPASVLAIAGAVLAVLVAVVIPQFEAVFANLHAEIPAATACVFRAGRFLRVHFWQLACGAFCVFCAACLWAKRPGARRKLDALRLALPVFGGIYLRAAYARSFTGAALLLSSGVAVAEALRLSGEIAANEIVNEEFTWLREGVMTGASMRVTMERRGCFSPMARRMLAAGEATGNTDAMFERLGRWYEAELAEQVQRLTSLLEPFVVLLVGAVVAFMAFSVFLPMISSIQRLI
jgi:type IV pilus assembly protein PilC